MELKLFVLGLLSLTSFLQIAHAIDEGEICVACEILASLLFEHPDENAVDHPSEVGRDKLCIILSNGNKNFQDVCLQEVKNSIDVNPDDFCARIGLCKNPFCRLFNTTSFPPSPLPPDPPNDPSNRDFLSQSESDMVRQWMWSNQVSFHNQNTRFYKLWNRIAESLLILKFNEIKQEDIEIPIVNILPTHPCYDNDHVLKCIVDRFANEHHPMLDSDGDEFSSKENRGLRGSHWHGADCNDSDVNVYPGRKQNVYSEDVDHDCNGIYGIDSETGISLEELFCSVTPRRGYIHIGDSATAHFHIPPQWMTRNGWNLENLIPDALDELDQPGCAWGTGYRNDSGCPYANRTDVSLGSVATRLRERNLCNHRDFQNIGCNGAGSDNAMSHLIPSVKRDTKLDYPALAVYSMIGNDVCNGHEGMSHMTTPEDFYNNVVEEMKALDEILPENSYVLLIGLVDGSLLWENLHDRQHPIGATYAEVYEALHCAECSPCVGWLTANETLRKLSTERAMELNEQFPKILSENSFQRFEAKYFNIPWRQIVKDFKDNGGDAAELFEAVDGFHPSHLMNQILSDVVWEYLEKEFPEAIGPINPFNDDIRMIFGDQGGF